MSHTLRYHPRVADRDLPRLPGEARKRIERAIATKLAVSPERFGKPLQGTLRPYRKLRVGDHRIVFTVEAREVRILAIAHRRDVYDEAARRRPPR